MTVTELEFGTYKWLVRYDFQEEETDEERAPAFTEDPACAKHSAWSLPHHITRADPGFCRSKTYHSGSSLTKRVQSTKTKLDTGPWKRPKPDHIPFCYLTDLLKNIPFTLE